MVAQACERKTYGVVCPGGAFRVRRHGKCGGADSRPVDCVSSQRLRLHNVDCVIEVDNWIGFCSARTLEGIARRKLQVKRKEKSRFESSISLFNSPEK